MAEELMTYILSGDGREPVKDQIVQTLEEGKHASFSWRLLTIHNSTKSTPSNHTPMEAHMQS